MFDCEAEVYTPIAQALRTQFSGIFVTGIDVNNIPKQFPTVCITEVDNYIPTALVDSGPERYSDVTFQVTVWTNNVAGKKTKGREIMQFVDAMMFDRNFERESMTPQTAVANGSVYWTAARYVGRVDANNFYRR